MWICASGAAQAQKRQDMLIYRSFDRELFTRGPRRGLELLLQVLRGEVIDWRAIEDEFTPSARCAGCGAAEFKQEFSLLQWKRKCYYCIDKKTRCSHNKYCNTCVDERTVAGTPLDCFKCGVWKSLDSFGDDQRSKNLSTRLCKDCAELRLCRGECGQEKSERAFSTNEWREAGRSGSNRGVCKVCNDITLECTSCDLRKPHNAFDPRETKLNKFATRKCRECTEREEMRQCSKMVYAGFMCVMLFVFQPQRHSP